MRRLVPALLPLLLIACSRDADAPATDGASAQERAAEAAQGSGALMEGQTRTFRQWEAVCDNTRTCTLFGFPPDAEFGLPGAEGWGFIRIERAAGPGTELVVTLASGEAPGGEAPPLPMTVTVDGGAPLQLQATGGDGPYYAARATGAQARGLVNALKNGRSLTVTLPGGAPAALSLEGAAAALLWADEVQGRVGARDALMRPGERSSVPAAPAPPVVRTAKVAGGEVAATPALLQTPAVAQCLTDQGDGLGAASNAEVTGVRLTSSLVLWQVPCGAGAYNQSTAFFYGDAAGGGLRPVPLSEPAGEGDGPANHAVNAGWDPETGRLTAFNKARGVGDCGSEDEWAWDGQAFVHTAQRIMGRCEGVWLDDWAVLRRSVVR
jgi:hypothetical protein